MYRPDVRGGADVTFPGLDEVSACPRMGITIQQLSKLTDQDIWEQAWNYTRRKADATSVPLTHEEGTAYAKQYWTRWRAERDFVNSSGTRGDLARIKGQPSSQSQGPQQHRDQQLWHQPCHDSSPTSARGYSGGRTDPSNNHNKLQSTCDGLRKGVCGLCGGGFSAGQLLEPSCGHSFCRKCYKRYILSCDFIRKQVRCPSCSAELASEQVKQVVGQEAFSARQRETEQEDAALALKVAQGGALICPRCGKEHEGSCEKYREWERENASGDHRFAQLMAHEQLRRCPVCGVASERVAGCNFMRCESAKCRCTTFWCYICGKHLAKEQHYSHYPRSPYENDCHTPVSQRMVH